MSAPRASRPVRAAALVAGTALAVALLAGCAQTPPGVVVTCTVPMLGGERSGPALVGQSYGMAIRPIPLDAVQFGSTELSMALAVQGLYASRTATQTVQVQVRLVSCIDAPQTLRLRTAFLRGNGAPAESPSGWKTVHLPPRATGLYEESSVQTDVASYLVEAGR